MHKKGGNFCIFLLKIAEKEGKTDLYGPWSHKQSISEKKVQSYIDFLIACEVADRFRAERQVQQDCRDRLA